MTKSRESTRCLTHDVPLNAGNDFWQRQICRHQRSTRLDHGLHNDAEGVAERSRGSERSFDPRIEERANTKHPEGMPDLVTPNAQV